MNALSTYRVILTCLSGSFLITQGVDANNTAIPLSMKGHIKSEKLDRSGSDNVTNSYDGKRFTIKEAIDAAVSFHPEIKANNADVRASEYRIDQARSGYFPTVDLRMGGGYEYDRQKFTSNSLNAGTVHGSVVHGRYDPSITVRQALFDGFDTRNKVDKATKEKEQAFRKSLEVQELRAFDAADNYIGVRRFQRLLKLAEENVTNHRQVLKKVTALVSGGKLTISDQKHVESRLNDAEAAVQDIQGDLDTAVAHYIDVIGQEPQRLDNPRLDAASLPHALDDAMANAVKSNRSLAVASATVDVAKADVATSESAFLPTLFFEGQGNRNFNISGKDGQETLITALAVARFNVFNGGKDMALKRSLTEKVTSARYRREQEQNKTKRDIRISWAEMSSARGQSEALKKAVESKKQVLNAYLAQFDLGTVSFLTILDATHEWFLAKGSEITANSTYDLAAVRLLSASGDLLKTYQIPTITH